MLSLQKFTLLFFSLVFAAITFGQLNPVGSGAFHIKDFPVKKDTLREGRSIVKGTLPGVDFFAVHTTTQFKGAAPKASHAQKDIEELIIIKEGTMKCIIDNKTAVLGKNSVLLVPPLSQQVFENVGNDPLTYYVFQFRTSKMNMERSKLAGGPLIINADTLTFKPSEKGGGIKYFDRPTAMTDNFEMHVTQLKAKGPSHAPHQHIETEIILIIHGETEMTIDGRHYTAGPGDFYIAESNKMHGMGNATDKPCSYFAFKWR